MEEKKWYGIGVAIKNTEDWKNFVKIYNSAVEGLENVNKLSEEFDGDADALPGYVALETVTLDELKTEYEKINDIEIPWDRIELLLKIVDGNYPICYFRM